MPLSEITRDAVLKTIEEFDRLGQNKFLNTYGFGPARSYLLICDGRSYDSKAIFGVAHKHVKPDFKPLKYHEFGGGKDKVKPALERLNFIVHDKNKNSGHLILPGEDEVEPFDPSCTMDNRERISRSIAERRGQNEFRKSLRAAYEDECAITGCKTVEVLEAAHIYPYRGEDTNKVDNGLLLRSDVHTLFDLGLITISPESKTVLVHKSLNCSEYWRFHLKKIRLPSNPRQQPSEKALKGHFDNSIGSSSAN